MRRRTMARRVGSPSERKRATAGLKLTGAVIIHRGRLYRQSSVAGLTTTGPSPSGPPFRGAPFFWGPGAGEGKAPMDGGPRADKHDLINLNEVALVAVI